MYAAKRMRLGTSQSQSMIGKVAVMGLLQRHLDASTSRSTSFALAGSTNWSRPSSALTEVLRQDEAGGLRPQRDRPCREVRPGDRFTPTPSKASGRCSKRALKTWQGELGLDRVRG
jgi:hypothetical protein